MRSGWKNGSPICYYSRFCDSSKYWLRYFDSNFHPSFGDYFYTIWIDCIYGMEDLQVILKNSSLYLLLHHKRGSYILVVVSSLVSSDAHGICLVLQTAPSLSLSVPESMALLARLCVYERPALSRLSGVVFIFCTVLGCHAHTRLHTARTPAPAPTTPGASVTINYDPSDGRILGSTLLSCKFNSSASESEKCDVHVRRAARYMDS